MQFSLWPANSVRRLFSPVIDKLLFAATKADHAPLDQHANMVACFSSYSGCPQNAAFEGITSMDCPAGVGTGDHRGVIASTVKNPGFTWKTV